MDKKQVFLLRYVALAFAVLGPLRRFIGASHTPNLSCSEFRQTLAAGQVGDVVVKEGVAVGRQIIEVHARNVTLAPKLGPGSMAARTPGFAGADRASLVNEATLRAARHGKDALDRIITGPEKTNRVMIPMERRFVVFHEAGHALVAELREATA